MPPNQRSIEALEKLSQLHAVPIENLDPVEARKEERRTTLPFLTPPEPVDRIENRIIPDRLNQIPVRIYWPKITEDEDVQDLSPITLFFHGGGWVLGSLDLYDELCCMLSNRSESIVVSVDYRLAPEHRFPAAIHDCYDATKWVAENASDLEGDEDTIVVAGESAGGTLAIDTCLLARDRGGPQLALSVPIYPVTDLARDLSKYAGDKFGPSKEAMDWFISHYIESDSELRDPLASPQYADLRGLPTTMMITAEFDPLREQELDFAERMKESGVKFDLRDYPGLVHGFVSLPGYYPEGRQAIEAIASEIKRIYVENEA